MALKQVVSFFVAAGLILSGLAYGFHRRESPNDKSYKYFEHPVEQIFVDESSYTTLHSNLEGRVFRNNYYENRGSLRKEVSPSQEIQDKFKDFDRIDDYMYDVEIYKDLEPGNQGYVRGVEFKKNDGLYCKIAEIHLPRDYEFAKSE